MMRGIRARLTVTLVALVALTAILLGAGAYLFVETNLHDQALQEAAAQAKFDLSVTVPDRGLPADPSRQDVIDSRLVETFLLREIDTIIDVGTGDPIVSHEDLNGVLPSLPADLRSRVDAGQVAYTWTTIAGTPSLVVGGRVGGSGPAFYFVHDVRAIEDALGQLRIALIIGTIVLILVALLVARVIARGVLAPVEAASRAAERLEHGDLSARVPVTSDDEFGTWAERFNRMAESLAETIGRLEAAESQNRRFVADVAHELRTPLAALVETIATRLRQDLVTHHSQLATFKRQLRHAQEAGHDKAWEQLCVEAEAMLGPTMHLAHQLSLAYDEIRQQSDGLETFTQGRTDPLTGVGNGRALEQQLRVLLSGASRGNPPFAVGS